MQMRGSRKMKIEKEKGTSYLVIKSSFYCFFDILTFRD